MAVVERHDAPAVRAREHRHVDDPPRHRRRRCGQASQLARPEDAPRVLVDRVQHRVVTELEDVVAAHHRRELQQRPEAARPHLVEGRVQLRGRGEVAVVIMRVAVQRPREAVHRLARCGFGHEPRVRVVNAAGAVFFVDHSGDHDAGDDEHDDAAGREPRAYGAGTQTPEEPSHAREAASGGDLV